MQYLIKYKEYLLIIMIPLLIYGASMSNGYNLDDELVIDNRFIGDDLTVVPSIFTENYFNEGEQNFGYRPIVVLSFFLETYFLGVNPAISHAINLLLYIILGVCLYRLSMYLSQDRVISAVAVLLFLVHPLHVEVVASAKNREELLAFLFLSLSAISSIRFINKKNYMWLIMATVCAILAVLSKKSALPGLLMIPPAIILFRNYRVIDLISLITILFIIVASLSPFPVGTLLIILSSTALFYLLLIALKQPSPKAFFNELLHKIPWLVVLHIITVIVIIYMPLKAMLFPALLGAIYLLFTKHRTEASAFLVLLGIVAGVWVGSKHIVIFCTFMVTWIAYQNKEIGHRKYYPWAVFGIGLILLSWILSTDFQSMFLFILAYIGFAIYLLSRSLLSKQALLVFSLITVVIGLYLIFLTSNYFLFLAICFTYALVFFKDKKSLHGIAILLPYLLVALFLIQNKLFLEVSLLPKEQISTIETGELIDQKSLLRDIGRQLHPTESVFVDGMSMGDKTATSIFILGEYLKLHIWPHPLRFYYGFAQITTQTWQSGIVWLYAMMHLMLGLTALYFLRRLTIYSYGIFFYLVCILPFSNLFVPMAGMMGERLTFIASFGMCLAIATLVHWCYAKGRFQWAVFTVIGLISMSLSYASYSRSLLWDNKLYLYENDIQYSEKSAKMNQLLGSMYFDASKISGKEDHLQNAVYYLNRAKEIYPDYFIYWVILGLAYQQFDYFTDAIVHYKKAIELNPQFTDSYFNVAVCAESIGDEQTAIDHYRAFIELEPGNESGYTNFSFFYFKTGRYADAIEIAQKAISLFPRNPNHHANLGKILLTLEDPEGAIVNFRNAANLNSSDPVLYTTLSSLLRQNGQTEEADYYQAQAQRLGINN